MQLSPLGSVIPNFGSPTLDGFDFSNIEKMHGQRLAGDSARQFVRFYNKVISIPQAKKVRINEKTGEVRVLETEMVNIEREFVEIITPGDKNTVDDFAQDFHRREHWRQYKAFRDGKSAPIGIPIEECSFIAPSVLTELKYLGVHTVEQLADASDVLCGRAPNGFDLREYARAVVKASVDSKSLGQVNLLKDELEKAQKMIAELQAQMTEVKTETAEIKRSPGRPKKSETIQVTE